MIKPFTRVSLVEQMIMNPDYLEFARVWRNYRIEYMFEDSPWSEDERVVWLPANFDTWKLEDEINACLKELQNGKSTD